MGKWQTPEILGFALLLTKFYNEAADKYMNRMIHASRHIPAADICIHAKFDS